MSLNAQQDISMENPFLTMDDMYNNLSQMWWCTPRIPGGEGNVVKVYPYYSRD
jgi:hypothetical protein